MDFSNPHFFLGPVAGKTVGIIIVYLRTVFPHASACGECLYILYAICKEVYNK